MNAVLARLWTLHIVYYIMHTIKATAPFSGVEHIFFPTNLGVCDMRAFIATMIIEIC